MHKPLQINEKNGEEIQTGNSQRDETRIANKTPESQGIIHFSIPV